MSTIRNVLALGACLLACRLCAWADPFSSWQETFYAQCLQVDRPANLHPTGLALDSNGDLAAGYKEDGLYAHLIEARMEGPLGWDGWAARLGVQTDLNSTTLSDAYAQWSLGPRRPILKIGQEYMPFGLEQQVSTGKLLGIQRSMAYAYGNYGLVTDWGLDMLNQRGWGLRGDWGLPLGSAWGLTLQAAAMDAAGEYINPALAGIGHAELALSTRLLSMAVGFSGYASRSNLEFPSMSYAPLGAAAGIPQADWVAGAGLGTKSTVLTWGPDASVDLGCLHGNGELAMQSLGQSTRGGGQLQAWLELPSWEARRPYAYARLEQCWSGFGDLVRRPDSLYKGYTLGFFSPLPWGLSLKLEHVQITDDDFPGPFPGSDTYQAQLQINL
jgi:hypothetical protein